MSLLCSLACTPAGKGMLVGWGTAKLSEVPKLENGSGALPKDVRQDGVSYQTIGSFLDLALSKAVLFEPQILYVRQGTHAETIGPGPEANQDVNLTLEYLQFPLLLRILLVNGEYFRLSTSFGTYFAHLLDARVDNHAFTLTSPKDFDQGLLFDMGLGVKTGAGTFTLDFRYAKGLSDISPEFNAAPQAFAALLGFSFP